MPPSIPTSGERPAPPIMPGRACMKKWTVNGPSCCPSAWTARCQLYADALLLLEANPGSFYVDPATNRLYTHAIAGGDPNADGVARQYVPALAATLGGRIIDVTGGEGAPRRRRWRLRVPTPTDLTSSRNGRHWVWRIGEISRSSILVSGRGPGSTPFPPSAISGTDSSRSVTIRPRKVRPACSSAIGHTSSITPASAASDRSCQFTTATRRSTDGRTSEIAPGGTDANPTYLALIAHSDDATQSFNERLIENCDFGGTISLAGPETSLALLQNSTVAVAPSKVPPVNTIIDESKLEFALPGFYGASRPPSRIRSWVPSQAFAGMPLSMEGARHFQPLYVGFDPGPELRHCLGGELRAGPRHYQQHHPERSQKHLLPVSGGWGVSDQ